MPDCCQTKEAITCENGRVTCLFLNVVSGTGVFPEQVTQLTVLTKPIFFGTGFTGEIPKDLGKLTKLKKLDLTHNRLTDQIPDLSGLKELTFMSLALNSLSGPIPDSLGKLTKLEALGLFNNKLTDSIPASLSDLSEIGQRSLGKTADWSDFRELGQAEQVVLPQRDLQQSEW